MLKLDETQRRRAARLLGQLAAGAAAAGAMLERGYNPGQPRDNAGRWASSGSGGGGGWAGRPANPAGKDTYEQYKLPNGKFTKERQRLHDEIVAKALATAKPVKNPSFHMMGGGPASGKSVALNSGKVRVPKNVLHVDSDELKKSIPEYVAMSAAKNPKAAAFVHEESSMLAKRIMAEGAAARMNVVLDGTGDGGIDSIRSKVATARAAGQRVNATYVSVDTEVAVARNLARAQKTGRLVPESFVRGCHRAVSNVVPQAIKEGLFDKFELYDTNLDGQVRLVASAKGKSLKVHDQQLWSDFIGKGGPQDWH